jgi:hypothetical protein
VPPVISGLGDDPDPRSFSGLVRAQEAATVDHGGVVQALVFLVEIAPVAPRVSDQELMGLLTGNLEGFKGTGRGDDLTEVE